MKPFFRTRKRQQIILPTTECRRIISSVNIFSSPEKKKTKGIAGATASYKVNNKNDHTPPTNPHSSPILPCH